jgi:hypothetical protein
LMITCTTTGKTLLLADASRRSPPGEFGARGDS